MALPYLCTACTPSYSTIASITSTIADLCSKGHWCPEGTPTGETYPCHAGSYNNLLGIPAWEQCVNCPEGTYCPAASILPTDCPAGTFRWASPLSHWYYLTSVSLYTGIAWLPLVSIKLNTTSGAVRNPASGFVEASCAHKIIANHKIIAGRSQNSCQLGKLV